MTTTEQYVAGSELPSIEITWKDTEGNLIDLTAYALELRIGTEPVTIKTTGLTPAATAPNATIDWEVDDLALEQGVYPCQLWATRISDSKDRDPYEFSLRITKALVAP